MRYYLAIDIGASSGRHILGHVDEGKMVLEELYRFPTPQIHKNGHDYWDIDRLHHSILEGLKACKAAGKMPATMGIDTWAVDFVLLDGEGRLVSDAVAYRDRRTDGMDAVVEKLLSPSELYALTGIQKQKFNTIYQLMALKKEHPKQLAAARSFLMIPEYFNFLLTGVRQNEYTNATTTGLVNARLKTWDGGLIQKLGLSKTIFSPLAMPGTRLGRFTPETRQQVGFDCEVMLPATHDTGSAFLAVPAQDDKAVYLSSGTWSLLGVENREPITTEESRLQNFTNEGGYQYRFRYLRNIMGLWMLQSIRRELSKKDKKEISFAEMETAARAAGDFESIVDVNNASFLAPDSMIAAVKEFCRRTGQIVPGSAGELTQCVYKSLAESYRQAVESLSHLTGRKYTSLNIVGGGSKDHYLSELTARATGVPVFAGPTEGTALGNLIVQMIAGGEYPDLAAARRAVKESFPIKKII
ncbi:MAG: rhamnulokinase [Oscillospiraceae bacterium]|jgi:rhamnulokinase|nr:rhamnulokinase [Oscillospiraceae bacterium]